MKRELRPCIYIMTNKGNSVLYTGVTSNLFRRVAGHKAKLVAGFTSRYNVTRLVYYEEYDTMDEAIAREKQIKGSSRQRKIALINSKNPSGKTCTRSSSVNVLSKNRHCEPLCGETISCTLDIQNEIASSLTIVRSSQ